MKSWVPHVQAPQGKTFTDIRIAKSGSYCEFQCNDGLWHDSIGNGNMTARLTHEEKLKSKSSKRVNSQPKKKGSLTWRIVKGIGKALFGIVAFSVGYNSAKKGR